MSLFIGRLRALSMVARIPLTVLLVFLGLAIENGLQSPDYWAADLWTAHFSKTAASQDRRIAIITLDERSLAGLPYTSPIDRGYLAKLIRAIALQRPKVIGLDLIFDRATEPSKDRAVVEAIRESGVGVVGAVLAMEQVDAAAQEFQQSFVSMSKMEVGHPYFDRSVSRYSISDEVVREVATPEGEEVGKLSLAEAVARTGGEHAYKLKSPVISWLLPPLDSDTFLTVPADAILADDEIGGVLRSQLRDRFVLVGADLSDRDQHLTPLPPARGQALTGRRIPGVEIQAQVLAQILDGRETHKLGIPADVTLILLAAFIGWWRSKKLGVLEELLTICALGLVSLAMFWALKVIFPFAFALIAWTLGVSVGEAIAHTYGEKNA